MLNNLRRRFQNFRRKGTEPVQLQQLQADLLTEATLDSSYLALIIGSCAIATFGLLSNSAAVIIGAMIIAPLMLPIRGLAFGALQGYIPLFRKGMIAITVGTLLAVAIAFSLGKLVGIPSYDSEVLAQIQHLRCWIWALPLWQAALAAMPKCSLRFRGVWQEPRSRLPSCHPFVLLA